MPVFSRLGPYDRSRLDRIAGHGDGKVDRRLIEYWAHEASLIPVEMHPLFRWRMADVDREAWGSISRIARERARAGRRDARARRRAGTDPRSGHRRGPAAAAGRAHVELARGQGRARVPVLHRAGGSGAAGQLRAAVRHDRSGAARPRSSSRRRPIRCDAQRELVRIAARALGVATEPDLGDYFRLPRADSKARVAELAAAGELLPVEVEGWSAPAYLWPDARRPRRINARALLSPFDSLIWFRPAHRAAVRLPLPDRDLHAGAQAHARLLRAAVPARRARWSRASISSPIARRARCSCRARSRRTESTAARSPPS